MKSKYPIGKVVSLLVSIIFLSSSFMISGLVIDTETNQELIITNNQPRMNKYPVEYTIVDHYANGESVVRGIQNSFDPVLAQEGTPPLSKYKTNLLGGDEIALIYKSVISAVDVTVSHFSDSFFMDTESFPDLKKGELEIGNTSVVYTELISGDFDGNFKDEIMVASVVNSKLRIQVLENWGDKGLTLVADSGSSGMWDCDYVISVEAGDFDGDLIDEFVVVGLNGSQPSVWVFDDIMNSIYPQFVHYGDNITLKTHDSPNHYRYSAFDTYADIPLSEYDASTIPNVRFTILNSDDRNSTGIVQFGDNITLFNSDGIEFSPWSDSVIRSERRDNGLFGIVHYNDFVTFEETSEDLQDWFKIVKQDELPRTFQDIILEPMKTITNNDYVTMDITSSIPIEYTTNGIASCNIDDDSYEELVLIGMDNEGWARAWFYDDAVSNFVLIHEISWVDQFNDIHPNVAVGDVDGDPQDEIVFSLTNNTFGRIEFYDDYNSAFTLLKTISPPGDNLKGDLTTLSVGDIDGDGYDEVIFANQTSTITVWDDKVADYALLDQFYVFEGSFPGVHELPVDLQCGDVDIDGTDEILYVGYRYFGINSLSCQLSIWDYNGTANTKINHYFESDTQNMNVVTGDFAADQFTVRYLEHELYIADEQLIAVMAAPPTQAGISQNYGDSSTSFGQGTSTTQSNSWGIAASFGGYVTIEGEIGIDFIISAKVKVEVETSLVAEAEATVATTYTEAYMAIDTSDATYNYVIFSACVYDLFRYEIVEAANPSHVGRNYSIHLPNTPSIEKWDIDFYNSHNSEVAHDIGTETFNHTIGFVTSYPTKDEISSLANDWLETPPLSVGKGAGTRSQQIDLSVEREETFQAGIKTDFKAGGGVSAATAGILGSVGAWGGTSVGWGEETMFSCEIGDIENDDDYIDFRYTCSLVVYVEHYMPKPMEDFGKDLEVMGYSLEDVYDFMDGGELTSIGLDIFTRGQGYYVLNYWVEVPLGWGAGAAEVNDYANDIIELLSNLSTLAPLVFYPVLATIPVVNLLYLWKRRR